MLGVYVEIVTKKIYESETLNSRSGSERIVVNGMKEKGKYND